MFEIWLEKLDNSVQILRVTGHELSIAERLQGRQTRVTLLLG